MKMNTFLRDAVATVFSSTLNELIVLTHGKCLRSSEIQKSKAEKDTRNIPQLKRNNLPDSTLNEIKLYNDLEKIIDVYSGTLADLQSSGTIHTLLETIDQQNEKNKKDQKLMLEFNSSMLTLKGLKSRLTDFKSEADGKLMQVSETLNNLKSDWRIISKVNELEYELVKKWEHTRFTQATIVGERDEEILRNNLSSLEVKNKAEQHVILDLQAYSKTQFERYRKLISMWKEKYSKELAALQASISEKEDKMKEVNKTYEKYNEVYCKHKKFIVEYLEHRAEQDRLYRLQIKRIDSTVQIQAWWRGVMVRRCLGPYKKKPKKQKKGKKSK